MPVGGVSTYTDESLEPDLPANVDGVHLSFSQTVNYGASRRESDEKALRDIVSDLEVRPGVPGC